MGRVKSKKHSIMRTGVVVIFVLVLAFWLFNMNNVFRSSPTSSVSEDQGEWAELKKDLNRTIENINTDFKKMKEEKKKAEEEAAKEIISEMVDNTKELTPIIEDESSVPTEPKETELIKNNNCPEWINCMPTFGTEARSCQIPAGCEGITQIAY